MTGLIPKRIGFLADTHSRKADGSDLPEQALDAFAGCTLIVHLGDIGQKGILARLGAIAPVLVPAGANKGYVPATGGTAPVKVIESGGIRLGLTFNITLPDKAIVVGEAGLQLGDKPLPDLLRRRFGQVVDVVAFGGTHRQLEQALGGVLFFNPGSPTLPSDGRGDDDLGGVAVLELRRGKPELQLVRLRKK